MADVQEKKTADALRLAHGVMVSLIRPNPAESSMHVWARAVEAEAKIRALLNPQERRDGT